MSGLTRQRGGPAKLMLMVLSLGAVSFSQCAGQDQLRAIHVTPSRSLETPPYSTANLTDRRFTTHQRGQTCESCWCGGPGDLQDVPLDVVVDFGMRRIVDHLVVTTCRLKGQQRLTDFDVYGWAETDWDSQRPLAKVRHSDQLRMDVRFEPVATTKICLRLLDNARPQHNFPHISEIQIFTAAGPARQVLRPTGLPRALSDIESITELEAESARLHSIVKSDEGSYLPRRLELVDRKLGFRREAAAWLEQLNKVDQRTRELLKVGVPEWAAAQSEALSKYVLWVQWWIGHQRPDGSFGGGWNDDVELVCGWPLACLAASDRRTLASLKQLADGVWNWGPIKDHAYSTYTDVEHSAEEVSYSQPRMVVLDRDNTKWAQRCARSTQTCLTEFTGINGAGRLQFRSDWFGFKGDRPTLNPDRPLDVPEGAKALKPALYAAWSGDDKSRDVVLRYGDTWLDAALQEYDGKPRGLLPARIEFATGRPQGIALRMPPMRAAHYHLIGCYQLTGDRKYLVPAESTIRYFLVERGRGDLPFMKFDDVEHMGLADQMAILASLWRMLSDKDALDPFFARWSRRVADAMGTKYESYAYVDTSRPELWIRKPLARGAFRMGRRAIGSQLYIGWLATRDKRLLQAGCYNLSRDLTDLWEPLTWWFYDPTETRVTSNDHLAHSIQTAATMLMFMYTGGCGPIEAKYPLMPVSWERTDSEFAALVLRFSTQSLKLLVCNLHANGRDVILHVHELVPGEYRVVQGPDAGGDDEMDSIAQSRTLALTPHGKIRLHLPARQVQVVQIDMLH